MILFQFVLGGWQIVDMMPTCLLVIHLKNRKKLYLWFMYHFCSSGIVCSEEKNQIIAEPDASVEGFVTSGASFSLSFFYFFKFV